MVETAGIMLERVNEFPGYKEIVLCSCAIKWILLKVYYTCNNKYIANITAFYMQNL